MSKSLLFPAAAAAALALGLAACDEQQASESSPTPMQQQQGAAPITPQSSEPPAMEPAPSDPTVPPAQGTQ
jgi:hypothetical protein